jgi:hypothetical protein
MTDESADEEPRSTRQSIVLVAFIALSQVALRWRTCPLPVWFRYAEYVKGSTTRISGPEMNSEIGFR